MDKRRLILLCVFSFSLVMLWDAWQKYNHPRVEAPAAQSAATAGVPKLPALATDKVSAENRPLHVPAEPSSAKSETVSVKTDLFTAQISAQGGDIVSLELDNYKATEDKTHPFFLFEGKHSYAAQSGLLGQGLPTHKNIYTILPGERELASGEKTIQLRLLTSEADGVKVSKTYTFQRGSYLIDVAYEIENGSGKEVESRTYYQLQRDTMAPGGESRMVSTFTGPALFTEKGKYQKIDFKDIEKSKAKFTDKADNGWIGMVQHYFVSAWIPPEKEARDYYVNLVAGGTNPVVSAGLIVPNPKVAPGAKIRVSASLYAGPQIQSMLNQLAKPVSEGGIGAQGFSLVVDYGWLTIVAAPIFWLLELIYKFVGNWGWAIVILTIIIKGIFFPLSAASYKSMAKMRAITPRLNAIRERCGDDKQKLNIEMMNLYKAEKINPLGGCLPILVQIPVFIALYWALLGAVEMRDAPWILWIKDLSSQDPYYVLPIVMMATMLIQTKLNPTPPDPIQAKITMIMPFVFGVMFFFFPAGLVLYWVVNNVLSIAQQWQITRMIEGGGKAANDTKA